MLYSPEMLGYHSLIDETELFQPKPTPDFWLTDFIPVNHMQLLSFKIMPPPKGPNDSIQFITNCLRDSKTVKSVQGHGL